LANSITNINAVGNSIANVNTVAGNLTNINTVAGISSDVTTVAGVGTEVGRLGTADAVADMNTLGTTAIVADMDTLADIAADITTLAHIEDGTDATDAIQTVASNVNNITTILTDINDVSTVASNISDVTTVAGISSNVTTVAGISSDVTTVANNISSINTKLPLSGGTMTGDITFNSTQTFDGRDVSADGAVIDSLATVATSGSYNDLSNTPTIPTNNNQLTNGAGYITSFDITTQTDSKYLRSDQGDTAAGDILFTGGAGAINLGAGSSIHATNGTWSGNHATNAGKIQLTGNNWYLQSSNGIIWKDSSGNDHRVLTTSDEGGGNGLDADTVDSLHASSFLRSDATDTKTAGFTTFNDSCSIKVGTNEDLEIYSTGSDVYFVLDNGCDLHIQAGSPASTKYKFDTSGDLELNDLELMGRFVTAQGGGNCGIGTFYPDSLLHLRTTSGGTDLLLESAAGTDNTITFKEGGGNYFRINHAGSAGASPNNLFKIQTATGVNGIDNDAITIKQSGFVGIGTDSPDHRFEVRSGNTNTAEVVAGFGNATIESGLQIDTNGNLDWGLNARNSRNLTFKTNQDERMRITSLGNVGIGTASPQTLLTLRGSTPRLTFEPTADTQNCRIQFANTSGTVQSVIASGGANGATMQFSDLVASTERMRISSNGNIGIGTTTPSEKLDVAGHIKVDSGPTLESHSFGNILEITTATGTLALGSANSSFAHFYTDREKYYFDEPIVVNHGEFSSYSTNDLKLYTNTLNEERLRIVQSTGHVGIGTSTPSHLLELESATPSDTGGIRVSNLLYGNNQDKPFLTAGTSGWTGANTNWNTFGWQFKLKSNSSGVSKMTIDVASGGTTIEGLNLLTSGRVGLSGADMFESWSNYANDLVIGNTSSTDTGISIVSSPASGSRGSLYFADAAGGGSNYAGFIDYYHNTNALRFGTASGERVRINSSGQVGILTSNPTYGLHVNSTGYFENQLSMTAPIQFNGTLDIYDAPGTGGSDTASDVAIALGSGHRIVGHASGYIRTLLKWNSSSNIEIGQGGTSLIAGIELLPGANGLAKVNGSQITTNKQFLGATNDGTTGAWHITDSNVTAYTDNMCVALFTNNIAGTSSGTTLEINSLGAKGIYYNQDSVLTTHYGPETLIMLIYTAADDRWYAHDFYYTSDDYRMRWQNDMTAGSLITGYQLLMEGIDGKMYPVTTPSASTTANTKAVQTAELRVNGLMLQYETSTDYAADATITANSIYSSIYVGSMEYWHNYDAGWATPYRPWYIVCTKNSNGNFVLDNSSSTSFLTQTLPTSDDGKYYIMGGWMHNNHDNYRLQIDHPIYVYKNGGVVQWSQYAESSGSGGSSTTAGSVIETLAGMCDGRQVTVGSGTYTLDTADHTQIPSTTYVDLSGSEISYTPPSGTNQVIYDFEYQASYYSVAAPLWHTKFYVDSDEVTVARFSRYNYYDDRSRIRVVLSLNNGTADIANGKLGTWTSAKTLKLQIRAYHGNYRPQLHKTHYFDGTNLEYNVVPTLTITAIA